MCIRVAHFSDCSLKILLRFEKRYIYSKTPCKTKQFNTQAVKKTNVYFSCRFTILSKLLSRIFSY